MTLQLVLAVEFRSAGVTLKRFIPGVNQMMGLQIRLRLESFLAYLALVRALRAVRRQVTTQVALTGEHLLAVGAGVVVRGGGQVVLQGFL